MKWRIEGSDRDTGDDLALEMEAETEQQARRDAERRGMLIARVASVAQETPIPVAYASAPVGEPQRGVSAFGIAALVLGLIACLIAWFPFAGLVAIAFVAVGFVMGVVGIVVSAVGRRSGVGMPLAGLIICLLAGAMAVTSAFVGAAAVSAAQAVIVQEEAQAAAALEAANVLDSAPATAPSTQPQPPNAVDRLSALHPLLKRQWLAYLAKEGDGRRSDEFAELAQHLDGTCFSGGSYRTRTKPADRASEIEVLSFLGLPDCGTRVGTDATYVYSYWRTDTGSKWVAIVHIKDRMLEVVGWNDASVSDFSRMRRYRTWSDVLGGDH